MFDFEKLDLYGIFRKQNVSVFKLINSKNIEDSIANRWKKASFDGIHNLVEGTGRIPPNEKKQYLNNARGNIFECTSLLQLCMDLEYVNELEYEEIYNEYERISKMLLGMLRSYSNS